MHILLFLNESNPDVTGVEYYTQDLMSLLPIHLLDNRLTRITTPLTTGFIIKGLNIIYEKIDFQARLEKIPLLQRHEPRPYFELINVRECAGWELNPHASRHMALNHACLPVPAPAQR